MEYVRTKCKKCGYEIVMPEKTGSVTCGSCGKVNTFSVFSSILKSNEKPGDRIQGYENRYGSIQTEIKTIPEKLPSDISKPSYKPIPAKTDLPEQAETPINEEEYEFPEQKTASKILTLIFILTPFIAMAVEFFKLPPYAAIAVIILIVVIALTFKKRS